MAPRDVSIAMPMVPPPKRCAKVASQAANRLGGVAELQRFDRRAAGRLQRDGMPLRPPVEADHGREGNQ